MEVDVIPPFHHSISGYHAEMADARPDHFATTRWTLVARAAGHGDSGEVRSALQSLCKDYWYPLYVYVRRRGHDGADASDLTQAFFAMLLERGDLAAVDRGRGRFRSYLLGALGHFLANEWRRGQAQKRGGGQPALSLDVTDAETRYGREPSHHLTPDRAFERQWALAVIERAMNRLRVEQRDAGKAGQFERLAPVLAAADDAGSYRQIGSELGMSEGAVKVAVHRMRRRMRVLLREEVSHTVDGPDDVDEELRHLLEAVAE